MPFLTKKKFSQENCYLFTKRILDVLLSLFLLFFSLPLFLLVAWGIKLSSSGSILFKQKRAGLYGKEFIMYKFRSMVTNAEQLRSELERFNLIKGPTFKMKDDPRLTKWGKFIRKTSLDELPQLWNVLKDDMSLVGPRPFPILDANKDYPFHKERLRVKPGLSCLWQINGRAEINDYNEWLRLDLEYINKRSISLDLKILLKTIPAVIFGRGAY